MTDSPELARVREMPGKMAEDADALRAVLAERDALVKELADYKTAASVEAELGDEAREMATKAVDSLAEEMDATERLTAERDALAAEVKLLRAGLQELKQLTGHDKSRG